MILSSAREWGRWMVRVAGVAGSFKEMLTMKIKCAMRSALWIMSVLIVVASSSAFADPSDYSDKDFGLRLASAFIRFTEVSASGGETVANRGSSSINPAAAGWTELPGELGLILAVYYSPIFFDAGTDVHVIGESLTYETEDWGTFQPAVSQIRSNRKTNLQGLDFDYSVDTVRFLWAKRFGEVGIGTEFCFSEAEVDLDFGPVPVSESNAESYRFRLGGLYEPAEHWLAGLAIEYGFAPYRATAQVLGPFGPMEVRMTGTQEQFVLRPGLSYEYTQYSSVYCDYQYGVFFSDRGTLNSHRFSGGVDHRLLEWLFVRGAASVDVRGNVSGTCGLGAYLSEWFSVDLAYQYDRFPELRPEFGRSDLLQLVFGARF